MPDHRSNTAPVVSIYYIFSQIGFGFLYGLGRTTRKNAKINANYGRMWTCYWFYIRTMFATEPAVAVFGGMLVSQ